MRELVVIVLLVPDADARGVYRASVPGLEGWVSIVGAPGSALEDVRVALQRLAPLLSQEEWRQLEEGQASAQARALPRGTRMERVTVRWAGSPALVHSSRA